MAALGAHGDDESAAQFRRQVKPFGGFRPRAPGDAEAGSTRAGAVDGNQEGLPTRFAIPGFRLATKGARVVDPEHPILHADRGQLARAHAEHRILRHLGERLVEHETPALHVELKERQLGGKQIAFRAVRPHDVFEPQFWIPGNQTVTAAVLLVVDASRKLIGRLDGLERHGVVANRGAQHRVALTAEQLDEVLECRPRQEERLLG